MKKVFLLSAVAGLVAFTSCKKENHESVEHDIEATTDQAGAAIEDGANDISEAADNVFEGAKALVTDAPEIENAELQEWVNKLHDEAVKAKAAATAGNQEELAEATATMKGLSESLVKYKADPEFGKAEAYYNEVRAELENL